MSQRIGSLNDGSGGIFLGTTARTLDERIPRSMISLPRYSGNLLASAIIESNTRMYEPALGKRTRERREMLLSFSGREHEVVQQLRKYCLTAGTNLLQTSWLMQVNYTSGLIILRNSYG